MREILFKSLFLLSCVITVCAALSFLQSRAEIFDKFFKRNKESLARIFTHLSRTRRTSKADAQLLDALTLIRSALKAGLAMPQAIDMVSADLKGVLGYELKLVVAQMKLGSTVDEALLALERRLPSEDITLFVRSVEVLRRTGGNLVECFDTLITTIDERKRVADKVRSLTAQGVAQAVTLLALPWFMALALHVLAPDFIEPLFTTSTGRKLLLFALFLETLGALWLRKIVRIRV